MACCNVDALALVALVVLAACTARPADDDPEDSDEPMTSSETNGSAMDSTTTTTTADSGATDPMMTTVSATATATATDGLFLSHDVDIQPIWSEHCTPCHSPGGEWQFLDLTPGNAYASIVNVVSAQATNLSFIEPGDPGQSYLWHKISGTPLEVGGGGLQMPKGMGADPPTVLSPQQLGLIEEWILAGAPP